MHTRADRNGGVGSAAKNVAEHASSLVRLELELAAMEVKRKVTSLGIGIGLGAGALLMALFGIGFLHATIAAALATFLPTWLALLLVTVFLFLQVGVLGMLALRKIKNGTPPAPEQAIAEAKRTAEALKSHG